MCQISQTDEVIASILVMFGGTRIELLVVVIVAVFQCLLVAVACDLL